MDVAHEQLGDLAKAVEFMQITVDYERAIGHPHADKHTHHLEQVQRKASTSSQDGQASSHPQGKNP